mgnify:FL=1
MNFELPEKLQHIAVERTRRRSPAGHPVINFGVAVFQQSGVAVKLRGGHAGQMRIRKAPQDQIHFPRAAMPAAEAQALAALLDLDSVGGVHARVSVVGKATGE